MGVVLEFRRKAIWPTQHRIRRLREAQGLTQRGTAARVEVPAVAIRHYEQGREQIPEPVQVELASVFGVSVAYLMGTE
jgi:transcriptional regulator with XRE-family HTH domain